MTIIFYKRAMVLAALLATTIPSGHDAFTTKSTTTTATQTTISRYSPKLFEHSSNEFFTTPNPATLSRKRVEEQQNLVQKPSSGTPLGMIVDERHEFELALGKCLDTLRSDYPNILVSNPDFDIYHEELETIDPSGVKLHGLKNYKKAWNFVHAIINVFYCPERSGLTFKMVYDMARNNIRVSWNAEIVPKAIFGGTKTTLHVDGISVYEISQLEGKITQHRVERLVINDTPVQAEKGLWNALMNDIIDPEVVPIPNVYSRSEQQQQQHEGLETAGTVVTTSQSPSPPHVMQFTLPTTAASKSSSSSLFAASNDNNDSSSESSSSDNSFDLEEYESKNAYRKKFGLKPLTKEEFEQVQIETQRLANEQQQRAASLAASNSAAEYQSDAPKKENFVQKLFGNALKDTCESNYDCERPQVCCDFGFTKKCCTSGMRITDNPYTQRQRVLVPLGKAPGPNSGYPDGRGPMDTPSPY
mmetsp:Transcript_12316/g.17181  ORF Transcript_12316/g.17181 Transcript_12316/m.17181 type:complete len:473 (+) Transcript_12316:124-1542(+)